MNRRALLALPLLPVLLLAQTPAKAPEHVITTNAYRAHMEFLASDLLEGREAGTRGYDLAARYVASEFRSFGLAPAGDDGTYFQAVPLRTADTSETSSLSLRSTSGQRIELKSKEDYLVSPSFLAEDVEASGEVVFVGYGITAPGQNHDDYRGVDVKGKIVAYVSGAPASFPSTVRAHYSSGIVKQETAASKGAIGTLNIRSKSSEATYSWATMVRQSGKGFRWIGPDGLPGRVVPQIRGSATLSRSGVEKLLLGSGLSVDDVTDIEKTKKRPRSMRLPVSATIRAVSKHAQITSDNVAAMVEGSDPSLKNEYVVYTAHLDHVGITAPVDGDRINNGAMDNATGIAALLEVARAFASLPKRPARSVVFLAVTAEEKGLLGSDYFAQYPTIASGRIVANLNMDMFLLSYPFEDSVVLGYEHSTLRQHVDEAAAKLALKISPDPAPQENSFVRSDQYSFVRTGVPAIAVNEGVMADVDGKSGAQISEQWRKTRYHQPSDDLAQPIYWDAGAKMARFNFLIGLSVANAKKAPRWNEGDFFGRTFARR